MVTMTIITLRNSIIKTEFFINNVICSPSEPITLSAKLEINSANNNNNYKDFKPCNT